MSSIDFYFDFSSPYSYIASHWIEAVAARHARRVEWKAILLGVTFAAAELKSPVSHPVKREYSLRDFERSARHAGVPYTHPARFPVSTQNAARVHWWLRDQGAGAEKAWARHCMGSYFTRGVDLSDPSLLKVLAAEFGLSPQEVEAVWSDPSWKARLVAENEAAVTAGVFGAPFFIADGEPFWGNDRRAQLERWLEEGGF